MNVYVLFPNFLHRFLIFLFLLCDWHALIILHQEVKGTDTCNFHVLTGMLRHSPLNLILATWNTINVHHQIKALVFCPKFAKS